MCWLSNHTHMYATRVYRLSSNNCLLCLVFEQPNRHRWLYSPYVNVSSFRCTTLRFFQPSLNLILHSCRKCSATVEKVNLILHSCRKCSATVEKVHKARNELAKWWLDQAAAVRRQQAMPTVPLLLKVKWLMISGTPTLYLLLLK